jgi:iron complex transport system substrate-binding protein
LSPNLTEIICHLGKGDCLVGRSSSCDYPVRVQALPVAGSFGVPALETLVGLRPEVLVTNTLKDANVRKTLENLGILVLVLPTESFEDYYAAVSELGEILACREAAQREIRRVQTALKERGKNKSLSPPLRVYLEVWDKPLMTVGNQSFLHQLIEYAGGRNIAAAENKKYFNCSQEWVIASQPEVIICPAMSKERTDDIRARPGWQDLPAVKSHHIHTEINQDIIYRMGPRILLGLDLLYDCINSRPR